jgi:DNA-binding MarR family transcriptional regulator
MRARAWQKASALRQLCFTDRDSLFADPGWEILLDLYIGAAEARQTTVSDACFAAGVPTSTGLRWLVRLEKFGLVRRDRALEDKRRTYVSLAAEAQHTIEEWLDATADIHRKLGINLT